MFSKKVDSIGAKTINKIAEMAFKKQIKQAKNLTVKVTTNRQQLAKGILDSLDIDGDDLIMNRNVSLEKMKITLTNLAVSPLKALMGNVELTQPSQGQACIILNEKDIETALDINNLNQQLLPQKQTIPAQFNQVNFQILADGKVKIKAKLQRLQSNQIEDICLTIKPRFCQDEQGVILDEAEHIEGDFWSSVLIQSLLGEAHKIFNLDNF